MSAFVKGDKVEVLGLGTVGTVYNVRTGEETGGDLYTVDIGVAGQEDRFFYAREFEIKKVKP